MPDIVVPVANTIAWSVVRDRVGDFIAKVTPQFTRVHREWSLRFDPLATMAQVTVLEGDNVGHVHGWLVGVGRAPVDKGDGGTQPPVIGGTQFDWWLELDVWGFLGVELGAQKALEDEFCAIARTIFFKQNKKLALPADLSPFVAEVTPLDMTGLDVVNFSEGHDAHFITGQMRVRIVENF